MQYKCNPEDKLHLPLKGDCTEHWQEQYLLLSNEEAQKCETHSVLSSDSFHTYKGRLWLVM